MTDTDAYRAGWNAFHEGARRIVPRGVLVTHGVERARAWYRGWDDANLAAPWDDDDEGMFGPDERRERDILYPPTDVPSCAENRTSPGANP